MISHDEPPPLLISIIDFILACAVVLCVPLFLFSFFPSLFVHINVTFFMKKSLIQVEVEVEKLNWLLSL